MRMALLFPPPANPSYVPMGVATLAGHVRAYVPDCTVKVLDLNIAMWEYLTELNTSGSALEGFLKGRTGDFYDKTAFMRHMMLWSELNRSMKSLDQAAKEYVESGSSGDVPDSLAQLLNDWIDEITDFGADTVCLSVMYLQQLFFALALAKQLKKVKPEIPVVIGGAALSVVEIDKLLVACRYVDCVVVGEGEQAAAALAAGCDPREIPGAVFISDQGVSQNTVSSPACSDAGGVPDFSDLDLTRYFSPEPVLPVLYSRGCRWRRCRFCAHNFSWGKYRKKTAAEFAAELEYYVERYHVRHFYFADQYIDAEDLLVIAQAILERGIEVFWHVMGQPVREYTRAVLELMYQAGCRWISWGVESGSQRLLETVDKGTQVPEVEQVVKDTAEAGISNLLMLIFGLPTSTDEDLRATFRFLESVYEYADAMTSSSFVLFDQTPFAKRAERFRLHVQGRQSLFTVGQVTVHSYLLHYKEIATDGTLRSPPGVLWRLPSGKDTEVG